MGWGGGAGGQQAAACAEGPLPEGSFHAQQVALLGSKDALWKLWHLPALPAQLLGFAPGSLTQEQVHRGAQLQAGCSEQGSARGAAPGRDAERAWAVRGTGGGVTWNWGVTELQLPTQE